MQRYFFLSYKRGRDDPFVGDFFRDLCGEIGELASGLADARDIGFMDRVSIRGGLRYSTQLVEAIQSSRVFLPLYSPSYFHSTYCGQEWSVYDRRMKLHSEDTPSGQVSGWLPIIWRRPNELPSAAEPLHFPLWEEAVPEYAEQGLCNLYRLNRFADARVLLVQSLAAEIIRVYQEGLLTEASGLPQNLHEYADAFSLEPTPTTSVGPTVIDVRHPLPKPARPPAAETGEPRYVHIVIASSGEADLSQVREDTKFYGATAQDWRPYYPRSSDPVVQRALDLAHELDLRGGPADIYGLADRTITAHRLRQIVMVVVDPWALKLQEHRDALGTFDSLDAVGAFITVPFNGEDDESWTDRGNLDERLSAILPRRYQPGDILGEQVGSPFKFECRVVDDLRRARKMIDGPSRGAGPAGTGLIIPPA